MATTIKIVGAYLLHKGRVLIIKHRKHKVWLPIGGHVKCDEGILVALKREVREETGLRNVVYFSKPFCVTTTASDEVIYDFVGRIKNAKGLKLQKKEVMKHVWLTNDEALRNKEFTPSLKKKIKTAFSVYKKYTMKYLKHNKQH
jgi:ADP-ribose pyrophosphatase YjhB (NUDIX family)